MSVGTPIEHGLFAVVCAALDDRLRPLLERLERLEARLASLEPDDEGLTYKQAALAFGVSSKTISRWVDAKKIAVGGGTRRSPRILRSEVQRVLHARPGTAAPQAAADRSVEGLDIASLARGVLSSGPKSRRRV